MPTTIDMHQNQPLSAEKFAADRDELPDGGRWVELVRGRVVTYQPPDVLHGNVVLNLSKRLAECLQQAADPGYACFELGLIVARDPDTVRVPQVSYYRRGGRFEQTDAVITEVRPSLVIEIASTNDRRRGMGDRLGEYLRWGVEQVWIIDPVDRQCHIHSAGRPPETILESGTLTGGLLLPEFAIRVADLFAEPTWWKG